MFIMYLIISPTKILIGVGVVKKILEVIIHSVNFMLRIISFGNVEIIKK